MRRQTYILTYEKKPHPLVYMGEGHTFIVGKKSLDGEIEFRLAQGCKNMRYYKIGKGVPIKESYAC